MDASFVVNLLIVKARRVYQTRFLWAGILYRNDLTAGSPCLMNYGKGPDFGNGSYFNHMEFASNLSYHCRLDSN